MRDFINFFTLNIAVIVYTLLKKINILKKEVKNIK